MEVVVVVLGLTATGRNEREENAKLSTLVAVQAASNRVGIIMVRIEANLLLLIICLLRASWKLL